MSAESPTSNPPSNPAPSVAPPVLKEPATQAPAALPPPTPAPSSPPPVYGPAPRFSGVSTNLTKSVFPAMQEAYTKAGYPRQTWDDHFKQDAAQLQDNNVSANEQYKNPLLQSTSKYMAGVGVEGEGFQTRLKNLENLKRQFNGFGNNSPETQYNDFDRWGKQDPAVKNLQHEMTYGAVDDTFKGIDGIGKLIDTAGKGSNPYAAAAMKADPGLKSYATNKMLGKGVELAGNFLTQNWGKIAAIAGGSGIAIMLLKQIMGGHEQQKQQQQPQRPQGPRFL